MLMLFSPFQLPTNYLVIEEAIKENDVITFENMLIKSQNINPVLNDNGHTALHEAANLGTAHQSEISTSKLLGQWILRMV